MPSRGFWECLKRLEELFNSIGGAVRVAYRELLNSSCSVICVYSTLRLLLEASVQYAYYLLMGFSEHDLLSLVARRERSYASFTATMVKRLKGVHGSRKKWILRTYLRLGEYTHPTTKVWSGALILDEDLLVEALDAVTYVLLFARRDLRKLFPRNHCRLSKTLKLLEES